jgi:hypothetical protein
MAIHEVGKAEVDGDAAGLLFLQPVWIRARERSDERALSMIDVPGRSDDDRMHAVCLLLSAFLRR